MKKYHLSQRVMHWLMAVIVVLMLVSGFIMVDMTTSSKYTIYGWHKSFGIVVLCLIILRICLRVRFGAPELPKYVPKYAKILSDAAHKSLYALMVIIPLSGYIMSNAHGHSVKFFNFLVLPNIVDKDKVFANIFHVVHEVSAFLFIAVLLAHMVAVIKHRMKDKNFIRRMW